MRKEYLGSFPAEIRWIESFPPEEEFVKKYQKVYSEHSANSEFLSAAEISCFLKHRDALKKIASSEEDGLIIEDDVEIPNFPFVETINYFFSEFNKYQVDIAFIGSFTGSDICFDKPVVIIDKSFKSRCAHCYFVSNNCAKKLAAYCEKIIAPFDWQLNYAIEDLNLVTAWTFPHINQRTEKGEIKSLLR
jgi:GR25 family glycosyltransferase involved in LPS biosynthesis